MWIIQIELFPAPSDGHDFPIYESWRRKPNTPVVAFDTKEAAEEVAAAIVMVNPKLIGKVEVVKDGPRWQWPS